MGKYLVPPSIATTRITYTFNVVIYGVILNPNNTSDMSECWANSLLETYVF
ncbi:hypothetical protein HanRHA438_Chr09g0399751 [Helianthus annuus]|nr:hypothetical protein HanRHA438_Chr09g0399751 [Helianthus annuus]